jgi:putative membrane protein
VVYTGNFAFALVMSLAAGFYVPIVMGLVTGLIPALLCWRAANQQGSAWPDKQGSLLTQPLEVPLTAAKVVLK